MSGKYEKRLCKIIEAEKLHIDKVEVSGSGHLCFHVSYRGQRGKMFQSKSPSDKHRVFQETRFSARQKKRELLQRKKRA